jgi:hypothetical protein
MAKIVNSCYTPAFENSLEGKHFSFTTKVIEISSPSKFKIPQIEAYNDSKDPLDHIETYKAHMFFQGHPTTSCVKLSPPP